MRLRHCRPAQKVVYLGRELLGRPIHHSNGLIVAKDKSASPTWTDVKAFLLTFDRAGLQGLVQDLYAASKDNQAFACTVWLGSRSARPLQNYYLALDKPRPDEEPNCISFKGQEGDRGL